MNHVLAHLVHFGHIKIENEIISDPKSKAIIKSGPSISLMYRQLNEFKEGV